VATVDVKAIRLMLHVWESISVFPTKELAAETLSKHTYE